MKPVAESKTRKLITHQSLIDWCNEQVKDGGTLQFGWDGGNDSGWCWLEKDGLKYPDNEDSEADVLINMMYNILDYGSWAGDFHASGSAQWNPALNAFVGEDDYEVTENKNIECSYLLHVPKHLWFDQVRIELDGDNDYVDSEVTIVVKNGFLDNMHTDTEQQLKESINDWVSDACAELDEPISRLTDIITINRSQFVEQGDMLVYTLPGFDCSVYVSSPKDIYLKLESNNDEEISIEEE